MNARPVSGWDATLRGTARHQHTSRADGMPKDQSALRVTDPGELSALIERIVALPASEKSDHIGADLSTETAFVVRTLERSYELILRYLNQAEITRNADGVDMALHLLNAANTGVSGLLLLQHGYPFQASMLLRHIIEVVGLVQASCMDEQNWEDFHGQSGKANYQQLLKVAATVVPAIREIHGRMSNYSQHISPLQGSLPLAEKIGNKTLVSVAAYAGPALASECSKVAKWLCATTCQLEIAVERLTYEFAGTPRYWRKEQEDGRVRFAFDPESRAWKEMTQVVDAEIS